jgi:hypothetical protein
VYASRAQAQRALWTMTLDGAADYTHDMPCACPASHLRQPALAAPSVASLRDLVKRIGHDNERAAMIYQHQARGADKGTAEAIDSHV